LPTSSADLGGDFIAPVGAQIGIGPAHLCLCDAQNRIRGGAGEKYFSCAAATNRTRRAHAWLCKRIEAES
jgi:hypothetical protein